MKSLVITSLTFAALASAAIFAAAPAQAAISDVDHPDIPNCVMFPAGGVNLPGCETLSILAIFPPNGTSRSEACDTVSYVNGKGETKTKQVCHTTF